MGDEGGLFLLINSAAPNSPEEEIIFEAGVSEFLSKKRQSDNKIILGKGNFGKVGLALSIFGDTRLDIGQLIRVKNFKGYYSFCFRRFSSEKSELFHLCSDGSGYGNKK